jgi:hypothetical protein
MQVDLAWAYLVADDVHVPGGIRDRASRSTARSCSAATSSQRGRRRAGRHVAVSRAVVSTVERHPALVAENVVIENVSGVALRLNINYNPEVGSKTFNVTAAGVGPICRLDVDGPAHRPAGRSHKHSLQTDRCAERNLPDNVEDHADLAGKPVTELFAIFCQMADITHKGPSFPRPPRCRTSTTST